MQENGSKKRIPEIDILKGIAIILVVIGHTRVPGNSFIYLFHMAVFFIASGYFYSEKSSETLQSVLRFTKKKVVTLWVPFSVGISVFTLLNNLFIRVGVLPNDTGIYQYMAAPYASVHSILNLSDMLKNILKTVVFSGNAQLAGTFWFFKTLFLVAVLYCVIDFCLKHFCGLEEKKRLTVQVVVSAIFLIVGYVAAKQRSGLGGMTRVLIVYCLYCGGHFFRKLQRINLNTAGVMAMVGVIILTFCNRIGTIALDKLEIVNPIFYLCCSFAGMCFLYGISRYIDNYLPRIGGGLSYIGKHSMAIMIGHFLSFKLVSYGIVAWKHIPYFCVAAFPVLTDAGLWWLIYGIVGVAVPLVAQKGWRNLISIFRR